MADYSITIQKTDSVISNEAFSFFEKPLEALQGKPVPSEDLAVELIQHFNHALRFDELTGTSAKGNVRLHGVEIS